MDDAGYPRVLDAGRTASQSILSDAELAKAADEVEKAKARSRISMGAREVIKVEREDDGSVNMYTQTDGSAALTGWPYTVPKAPYNYQVGGSHYDGMVIQPHEYITKNKIGWSAGNAIKYLSRYRMKGGADDVRKAIHYCQLLLAEEYGE